VWRKDKCDEPRRVFVVAPEAKLAGPVAIRPFKPALKAVH
jgi:hypothetical protein